MMLIVRKDVNQIEADDAHFALQSGTIVSLHNQLVLVMNIEYAIQLDRTSIDITYMLLERTIINENQNQS